MQTDKGLPADQALEPTERTKLKRFPVRGKFDRATINGILDSTPIGHMAFNHRGPALLPTVFGERTIMCIFTDLQRTECLPLWRRSENVVSWQRELTASCWRGPHFIIP